MNRILSLAALSVAPNVSFAACGDGVLDGPDLCDDGALLAGDGCSDLCAIEPGFDCAVASMSPGFTEVLDIGYAPLWVAAADGAEVTQANNSDPGVFLTPLPDAIGELTLDVTVGTDVDDDFVGLVIGYAPGEADADPADWLLFDWKQATQTAGPCTALAGTALSRVTGPLVDQVPDLWCHQNAVEELARGDVFGAVGWTDFVPHEIRLVTTPFRLEVWIDGALDLAYDGPVPNGVFGLYTLSQEGQSFVLVDPAPGTSACWPLDTDGDRLYDPDELALGTDPNVPDTDQDGILDGPELPDPNEPADTDGDHLIDALDPDDDGDGLPTADEATVDHDDDGLADYLDPDDDGDGLATADEGAWSTSWADADSDDDGLLDGAEVMAGADPMDADTDDDGAPDGAETVTSPVDADSDDDGWLDPAEPGTDPTRFDTDGDGLSDGLELGLVVGVPGGVSSVNAVPFAGTVEPFLGDADPTTVTDPLVADHDADGLPDGQEDPDGVFVATIGGTGTSGSGDTDPLAPDTDGDGLLDGADPDPRDVDTDDGGVPDGIEVGQDATDPVDPTDDATADPDQDGLLNADEALAGTDRLDADTDGDLVPDPDDLAPLDADRDDDGLADGDDPGPDDPDIDDDGLVDGLELGRRAIPAGTSDGLGVPYSGSDGYAGDADPSTTTNVLDADTDDDGLPDGLEDGDHDGRWTGTVGGTGTAGSGETDPTRPDTDADTLLDGAERALGTSPLDLDTDDGTIDDGIEIGRGTDPLDPADDLPQPDPKPRYAGSGCGCDGAAAPSTLPPALLLALLATARRGPTPSGTSRSIRGGQRPARAAEGTPTRRR